MTDKTEMTIAAYNQHAAGYAKKFMEYGPYAAQLAKFAKLLPAGAETLDVGCGPGNTAKQLLELKQVKLTGLDLSEKMVELARNHAPAGTFLVRDIRTARFLPAAFDAVVLSFCIVHLETAAAEALIDRAVGWLRPGGHLYLSFMEGKQAGFETTSFSEQPVYFNYFPGNAIEQRLRQQAMAVLEMLRQDYPEADGSMTTDVFIFSRKAG